MPLFTDRHDVRDATAEEVAAAYQHDIRVQAQHACRGALPNGKSTYWRFTIPSLLVIALLAAQPKNALAQRGTIAGRVVEHATGRPLEGVSVSLRGTSHRIISNDEGGFAFAQLEAGVYWLEFRLIGYAERTDSVRLDADSRVEIEARLAVSPVGLPPITVAVGNRSIAAWLASRGFPQRGFESRAKVHLTFQQIRLKSWQNLSELLRSVRGVRIRRLVDGANELLLEPDPRTSQGSCKVGVYLNGANVEFGNFNWMGPRLTDRGSRPIRLDDIVRMSNIDGLELHGPESNPVASDSTCGTLMIWSSSHRNQVDEAFTGTIRGTAVDTRTNDVISGVRVVIEGTGLSAVTDASGKFELPDVLPGRYVLSAHYADAEPWLTRVDVLAYGIVELSLQLERRQAETRVADSKRGAKFKRFWGNMKPSQCTEGAITR